MNALLSRLSNLSSVLTPPVIKRVSILVIVIVGLWLLHGQAPRVTNLWHAKTGAKLTQQYTPLLRGQYNESQWGLLSREVDTLHQWGSQLLADPALDPTDFEEAISNRFPFMREAVHKIYSPWSRSSTDTQTGIVICAGSGNLRYAAHLIKNLRKVLGSDLDIEIAYAGDGDLHAAGREYLANLDPKTSFIDLLQVYPHARFDLLGSGWATKPFALLAARHSRTILLDADAIFFSKPDQLFDVHTGLQRTGALFYHDRAAVSGTLDKQDFVHAQLEAAGRQPSEQLTKQSLFWKGKSYYEVDSGLVAVDKSRPQVFLGIMFAAWMNTKTVREKVTYDLLYGDKETFFISMELIGAPYSMPTWYAGSMGVAKEEKGKTFNDGDEAQICAKHMLHVDESGQEPFWINSGIDEDKDDPSKGYAVITHWWMKVENVHETPSWWWEDGNKACLKEKGVRRLSAGQVKVLEDTIEEAKKIDAQRPKW